MGRPTEEDPRYQRVRGQLRDALVELAQVKPVENISVSELTQVAGVSRTTFYKHGTTPVQFLSDMLVEDIRPYLERMVEAMATPTEDYLLKWRAIYIELLEAIAGNRAVNEIIVAGEGQAAVLAEIQKGLREMFSEYVHEFRRHLEGDSVSELWTEMAVEQQVHNLVVVATSWLRTGMVDSPEVVVNTYLSLAPPWQLARFSAAGMASMKRARSVAELAARVHAVK